MLGPIHGSRRGGGCLAPPSSGVDRSQCPYTQRQAFLKPQARTVEQHADDPYGAFRMRRHGGHLLPTDHILHLTNRDLERALVQEQRCCKPRMLVVRPDGVERRRGQPTERQQARFRADLNPWRAPQRSDGLPAGGHQGDRPRRCPGGNRLPTAARFPSRFQADARSRWTCTT